MRLINSNSNSMSNSIEIRFRREQRQLSDSIALAPVDQGGLLTIGSPVEVSCRYQPIIIILYASRMTTALSAIQADSV